MSNHSISTLRACMSLILVIGQDEKTTRLACLAREVALPLRVELLPIGGTSNTNFTANKVHAFAHVLPFSFNHTSTRSTQFFSFFNRSFASSNSYAGRSISKACVQPMM